jgi:histidinol-phosphate aminotransferase
MQISRRSLLTSLGAGAAAATVGRLYAWEPAIALGNFQVKRATPRSGMVILSSNENPYGPLPKAAEAMRNALAMANRYPFRQTGELADQLAHYHNVASNQVVLGNGSTEVLRMAVSAFSGPGKKLIYAAPTFEAAAGYAQAIGAELVAVPLTASYAHDLDAMLAATRGSSGLIYICNPNNPTASITPHADLSEFVRRLPESFAVLIDEAYHHFAASPGYTSFIGNPRVITARTFSKVYGMAGVRLGYGVSSAEQIERMRPHQLDTNISSAAAAAGTASLEDDTAMKEATRKMVADREEFLRQAQTRNRKVVPSFANFAMVHTGRPARELGQKFNERGILVGRPFPAMDDYLRISFGTPAEMQQFWRAWDELLPRPA